MPSSSSSSTGRGSPDPYLAIDAQPEPLEFARFLELRGAQPHQRRLRRAFLAFAGIRPGARVLDLGCGTGVVTRDIAARVGARGAVVGVDPSRAFVAEARRRARRAGARCRFRVADGRRLPFAARAFDAAVAVTVLLHVPRSDQVLAEMVRVTRSGGRVAVLDQDLGTLVIDLPDRALTRRIIDGHAERFYPNPWSGRGLLRRLRAAGLRRVRGRAFVVVERPTTATCARSSSGAWRSPGGGASSPPPRGAGGWRRRKPPPPAATSS